MIAHKSAEQRFRRTKINYLQIKSSLAILEAFIEVKVDDLELLKADDIDKKLKQIKRFGPKWPPFQIFQSVKN